MKLDLSRATKEQLYQIANDENNRMLERYEAARELQRRKEDEICGDRSID